MTQEKKVFRVTFERIEDKDCSTVRVEAIGNPSFLFDAMAEVLTHIVQYTDGNAHLIMNSDLGKKTQSIVYALAEKTAANIRTSVDGDAPEEVEEHVLEITPEMEKEAAEEEARNEQN